MKTSIWARVTGLLRDLLSRIWRGRRGLESSVLLPTSVEELLTVLGQAKDNGTVVSVVGGAFPSSQAHNEVTVSLLSMDRLLGLDSNQRTVTVEPGMTLSVLSSLLSTVHLCLDISGNIPDLTVLDALAVGVSGSSPPGSLAASLIRVEVVTPGGEVVSWSWNSHPRQMSALVCGLGTVAILTAATFSCNHLTRVNEISYLSSVRELLDTWSLVSRSSRAQEIHWFPFTELVVITHTSELDRLSWASSQTLVSHILGAISQWVAAITRKINLALFSNIPLLSSMMARVQFISLWTAARYRSDSTHHPVHFSSCDNLRGSSWILPLPNLPNLIHSITSWSCHHPRPVTSPLYISSMAGEPMDGRRTRTSSVSSTSSLDTWTHSKRGFLHPRLIAQGPGKSHACVWYDWFLPETSPDPTLVSQFEDLFLEVGGVRCWSAERLVSPLLLSNCFTEYRDWCQVKEELDPDNVLGSGYVQGTLVSSKKQRANEVI